MGVKRAEHAAEAARRRYLAVDPTNRLVADQLEADWNNKLRELADAKTSTSAPPRPATGRSTSSNARIRALAADLPALWDNPATPMRERKRLIRLLVTDVTLIRGSEQITAHVRLSGGQQHTLHVPRPLRAWEAHTTPATTITLIDQLLDEHTYDQTVKILNSKGLTGGWGNPFTVVSLPSCASTAASPPPPPTPSRRHAHPRGDRRPARRHPDGQSLATTRTSPAAGSTVAAPTSTTPARPAPPDRRPTRRETAPLPEIVRPDCQAQPSTIKRPTSRQQLRHRNLHRRCSVKHTRW